jgi:hypothetical protein
MDETKHPLPAGDNGGILPGWPNLEESWCPYCDKTIPPTLTRQRPDAAEYRCPDCNQCHTRFPDDFDQIHWFYPDDIDATMVAEPLTDDWREQWFGERKRLGLPPTPDPNLDLKEENHDG